MPFAISISFNSSSLSPTARPASTNFATAESLDDDGVCKLRGAIASRVREGSEPWFVGKRNALRLGETVEPESTGGVCFNAIASSSLSAVRGGEAKAAVPDTDCFLNPNFLHLMLILLLEPLALSSAFVVGDMPGGVTRAVPESIVDEETRVGLEMTIAAPFFVFLRSRRG
jgi:hypothetical protein